MTPLEVCAAFERGIGRPVRYVQAPIRFDLRMPAGYGEHLRVLQRVLGEQGAPYFGPELEDDCTREAWELWGGPRSMEEYAREAFIVEEIANGQTWMDEGVETPSVEKTGGYFRGGV
jgi:hypothetical protein